MHQSALPSAAAAGPRLLLVAAARQAKQVSWGVLVCGPCAQLPAAGGTCAFLTAGHRRRAAALSEATGTQLLRSCW